MHANESNGIPITPQAATSKPCIYLCAYEHTQAMPTLNSHPVKSYSKNVKCLELYSNLRTHPALGLVLDDRLCIHEHHQRDNVIKRMFASMCLRIRPHRRYTPRFRVVFPSWHTTRLQLPHQQFCVTWRAILAAL